MEITYSKQAVKYLRKLDAKKKQLILMKINQLPDGDIQPLKNHQTSTHRMRVGNIRVIFKMGVGVDIIKIGARGDVYK